MDIKELLNKVTKNMQNNAGYRVHSPIIIGEAFKEECVQRYGKQQIEQMISDGKLVFIPEWREE